MLNDKTNLNPKLFDEDVEMGNLIVIPANAGICELSSLTCSGIQLAERLLDPCLRRGDRIKCTMFIF